jgi:hypothetical protein
MAHDLKISGTKQRRRTSTHKSDIATMGIEKRHSPKSNVASLCRTKKVLAALKLTTANIDFKQERPLK